MDFTPIPVEARKALYDHYKKLKAAYREEAIALLGARCTQCASTEDLRIRFRDQSNPVAKRYRSNPITLLRRARKEADFRGQLHLLCRTCRLQGSFDLGPPLSASNPGNKPLESTSKEDSHDNN